MNAASLIGLTVGGMIAVYFVASLLEWAIFKRVVDTAPVGITLSVVAAVALAVVLYGFGNADGGPWNPLPGGVTYIVAGAIVWALKLWSYRRRAAVAQAEDGLGEIFE
jgi:hypothetical protein